MARSLFSSSLEEEESESLSEESEEELSEEELDEESEELGLRDLLLDGTLAAAGLLAVVRLLVAAGILVVVAGEKTAA